MDNLVKVLLSLVTALVAAGLISLSKIKQLYLVVPKLFPFSALTDRGTIIELQVLNRGRSTEEDVRIDLPPHIVYELVATDQSNARVESNSVVLPRLPPRSEASAIVLSDAELNLSAVTITISSKTTKGKVFKKLSDVPPNMGSVLLGVLAFIAGVALVVESESFWFRHEEAQEKATVAEAEAAKTAILSPLMQEGWADIDGFVGLDMHKNYLSGEFPFRLSSATAQGKELVLTFDVINKTAFVAKFSAYFDCKPRGEFVARCQDIVRGRSVFNGSVAPLQSEQLIVSGDLSKVSPVGKAFVNFSFEISRAQEANLYGARFYPSNNADSRGALAEIGPVTTE
jgi:hypothetical protein